MKKFLLPTLGLLASLANARAQFFYPSNLVVVQQSTASADGEAVTLVQYQTNGTLVNTTTLPSVGSKSFVIGSSTTEGFITLSANSNFLVLAGYNTTPLGSAAPSAATSAAVPRAVATVDAYDNYALPIANPNIYSTFNCRGAASDGLGNFWTSGSGGTGASIANGELGIIYVGTAANPTNVCVTETGTGNERCLDIYNGNLYLSTGSSTHGVFLISNVSGYYPEATVSPASANAGSTNVMLQGTGSGPYAFQINAAGTLAYVAEENLSGVIRYTNNGNGWGSNYTLSVLTAGAAAAFTNAYGCAVDWSQSPPVIYATTSETSTNRLIRVVDNGPSSTPTLVATAATATAFRGVRFGPQLYAYISVPPVSITGAPGATATFSATVLGSPTPTSQWYSNSAAAPTFVAIPGATATNYSLANLNLSESGSQFYLVVSNVYGVSTSAPATLTVENPAIADQPVGATNFPGTGPVTLCVTAEGTAPLTYQWYSNSVSLGVGAQSSCYTVPSSAVSNTAAYSVVVSNGLNNSITSTPTFVSFTPYLLYDTFNYANGNLFTDPGSPWTDINGTNPELVTNHVVQISVTNATTDAQSLYSQTVDNTTLWASFNLNVSQLPANAGGAYFANFEDTNFDFYGRIFLLTSNAPALTPDIPNVAYPGTYRVGIANGQTDSSPSATTGPTAVVELDMSPGINYNLVIFYQTRNYSQLAVNPSPAEYAQVTAFSPNSLTSGFATDRPTGYSNTLPMAAYGLRQRTAGGVMYLGDLEVSYDYNGAGSGFGAVTAGVTTNLAVIGFLTPGITNYAGNSGLLEVAASGIDLTYQWCQNGVPLSDGNSLSGSSTYALTINPFVATNSGSYTVVISNEAGSVTSSIAPVLINAGIQAPSFTLPGGSEPASNTVVAEGGNATFTATAVGTGPITYQWYFGSLSNPQGGSSPSGTLILTSVSTNQSGNYFVVATGGTGLTGTSSNALLTVNGPVATNIHYLRTLIDSFTTFAVSDTTTLYTIQGVCTVATNLTSGDTASFYVQDSTGGINLFITGDSTFRPGIGDVLTATGTLSSFDDNLELDVTAGQMFEVYSNTGVVAPLPTPQLLPWGYVAANVPQTTTNIEGSWLTMTNVYFSTNATATGLFTSGTTAYPINNGAGQTFDLFVSGQDTNFDGEPIPSFAYSVTGVLYQSSATAYALIVTRYSDMVTNALPLTNLTAMLSGTTNITLTWSATPYSTYSVWSTTNLTKPFVKLASGLWFNSGTGTYTDVGATNTAKFYEIVSP